MPFCRRCIINLFSIATLVKEINQSPPPSPKKVTRFVADANSFGISQRSLNNQKLLDLHNIHRRAAGLAEYTWDSSLQTNAAKLTGTGCFSGSSGYQENSVHIIKSLDGTLTETEAAEGIFIEYYETSRKVYEYPTEEQNFSDCFTQNERWLNNTDDLQVKVQFLSLVMREQLISVGCSVQKCQTSSTNQRDANFLLACEYGTSPNNSQNLFSKYSFVDICLAEPDEWQSCNDTMEKACRIASGDPEEPDSLTPTQYLALEAILKFARKYGSNGTGVDLSSITMPAAPVTNLESNFLLILLSSTICKIVHTLRV